MYFCQAFSKYFIGILLIHLNKVIINNYHQYPIYRNFSRIQIEEIIMQEVLYAYETLVGDYTFFPKYSSCISCTSLKSSMLK